MTLDDTSLCAGEGFRKVQRLSSDEQRELLQSGSPRQRVWAAWALGLSLEDEFADEVRDRLAGERVPGVRRHLIVMVAGYGEADIVAALARHDPDAYVRSTAARYVLALADKHPDLWEVAREIARDPSDFVRATFFRQLPESAPEDLKAMAPPPEEEDREDESSPQPSERKGELVPYDERVGSAVWEAEPRVTGET